MITNKYSFPEPLVRAVIKSRSRYSKGQSDYSATQLQVPVRINALRERHREEITEDVSDIIYSVMGSLGHSILELAAEGSDDIVEKRFFYTVAGKVISGQADLVRCPGENKYSICDYKFTSVYSFKDGIKPEYEAQLNILEYLLTMSERDAGREVEIEGLYSVPIYRDWSKSKSNSPDYPQTGVEVFECPRWGLKRTEQYITEMVRRHEEAKSLPDDELPICTPEERWETTPSYGVIAEGNSKATKTFWGEQGKEEAESLAVELTEKSRKINKKTGELGEPTKVYTVKYTPGESKRCVDWCSVCQWCNYYKEHIQPKITEKI